MSALARDYPLNAAGGEEWVAPVGESVRRLVRLEDTTRLSQGLFRHLLRDLETGSYLEWTTGRRYRFARGELLHVSGRIHAHTHRSGVPVSVLRECFNPLREIG